MAELYKSKDIYRKISVPNGDDKLVPIRGLYVVGEHLEPTYNDSAVLITDINITPASIVDYTDKRYENSDQEGTFSIIDVGISSACQYTSYTRKYVESYHDEGAYSMINVGISSNVSFEEYSRKLADVNNEGAFSIIDVDMDVSVLYDDITSYIYQSQPDQMLVISNIEITALTIDE